MRKFQTLALLVSVLAMAGCETIKGMGRDVQNLGEAMQGNRAARTTP